MIPDFSLPVPPVSKKRLCCLSASKYKPGKNIRRQGGRKLSWLPLGSFAIERKEELRFPDGRQYCLTSTICRNPHYNIKDAKSTQTDFSTSSSSKCDVATQVSTVQTFTLGTDPPVSYFQSYCDFFLRL